VFADVGHGGSIGFSLVVSDIPWVMYAARSSACVGTATPNVSLNRRGYETALIALAESISLVN